MSISIFSVAMQRGRLTGSTVASPLWGWGLRLLEFACSSDVMLVSSGNSSCASEFPIVCVYVLYDGAASHSGSTPALLLY